jgi:hypothetical protein
LRSSALDLRAQPIFNHHFNPRLENGQTLMGVANQATLTRVADTRLGSTYCEKVDFPNNGIGDAGINITLGLTPATIGFITGRKFSISFDLLTLNPGGLSLKFSRQGGATSGSPINANFVLPESASPTRYSFDCQSFNANAYSIYVLRASSGVLGTFYIGNFMIGPPGYTGPMRDGASPGWKWRGNAGASASVGWPVTT